MVGAHGRGRVRDATAPGGGAGAVGYRGLMLAASLRLAATRHHRGSRAVARALRSTALGRADDAERGWVDRIGAYRRLLPDDAIRAVPDPGGRPDAERIAEAREAIRWMSIPPVLGALCTRIVRELEPRSCLELGTGFGLSTAYQAAALELNGAGKVTSLDIEGMADLADACLQALGLSHRVELVRGRIERTISEAVERAAPIDLALLDADHTEQGTLSAFEAVATGLAGDAVVIVDDINWTDGMRAAWSALRAGPRVRAAVGLRRLGILVVGDGDGRG
jgi:predicted O-methyltransferase YrrM